MFEWIIVESERMLKSVWKKSVSVKPAFLQLAAGCLLYTSRVVGTVLP
jgi:hypothetical protein